MMRCGEKSVVKMVELELAGMAKINAVSCGLISVVALEGADVEAIEAVCQEITVETGMPVVLLA